MQLGLSLWIISVVDDGLTTFDFFYSSIAREKRARSPGGTELRVLQINSVCGVGSTGRIAVDLDGLLRRRGHDSYVAYGRGPAVCGDGAIRIGNRIDSYIHVVKTRVLDRHGYGSRKATRCFLRKVDELDPDVIHLHNIHGYYLNVTLLFDYLRVTRKPVVWTLHDCWPFTGHCCYFDYVGCYRWRSECRNCPQKGSYPASLLIDNSKKNFMSKRELFAGIESLVLVTPSQWLAGLVRDSFLGSYPVRTIRTGIDLDIFRPTTSAFRQEYGLDSKFIVLGVASVWEQRKGFSYLLELSRRVEKDIVIVIVGLTKEQRKALPENIVGLPRMSSARELAGIYSAADVFVNPTLEDNFPTTNLEALACGTPVITFRTGGSVECIDETCGLVVDKGNISQLSDAVREVKVKGKYHYSKASTERATRLYDKRARFCEYVQLYTSLCFRSSPLEGSRL